MRFHLLPNIASVCYGPRIGMIDAIDHIEHRTFARSVGTDNRQDLMFFYFKTDIGQCFDATKGE